MMAPKLQLYLDLIRWDRPAGSLLLLWPTLSALWIAGDGFPGWHLTTVFVLGTILMRSAGCCVNDVADREFDRHVKRTAERPVTRGAVSVGEALALAALLALAAFGLVLTTNPATIMLSYAGLMIAIGYPYAKRLFSLPQAVLGVAFSFGIPMAFAATQGGNAWTADAVVVAVPWQAWALLVSNLFWVLAYDTEYAMVDRDDDLKLGLRTSAIAFGRFDVVAVLLCYAAYLAAMVAIGRVKAMGPLYYAGLFAALCCVLWHWRLIRGRDRSLAFRAFLHNHWLGLAVFAGIALDYAVRLRAWPRGL